MANLVKLREAWKKADIEIQEDKIIDAGCGAPTKIKGKIDNYKPFVKNRVREIQNLTERDQWSHCPGEENPTCIRSRGIPASDLAKNSLW
ncbi:DUF1758 domain-containing protein [Nephila pilipes]|uniref:DUF1758 domain-containing protein n=1 Tax=Nephila pilipes TaxID=299642 RepID=A0A8X6QI02_NEPPI|nr:DUF1758 domain-containing protein [Nephila pilipes]